MFEDLDTVIEAAIGAVFGSIVAPLIANHFSKQRINHERHEAAKLVSDALRGEVKSLRSQCKVIYYEVNTYLESPPKPDESRGITWHLLKQDLSAFSHLPTPVFDENLANIGCLWSRVTKNVVEYYSDLIAVARYCGNLSCIEDRTTFDSRAFALRKELESLIGEATAINSTLGELSLKPGYPKGLEKREKFLEGRPQALPSPQGKETDT